MFTSVFRSYFSFVFFHSQPRITWIPVLILIYYGWVRQPKFTYKLCLNSIGAKISSLVRVSLAFGWEELRTLFDAYIREGISSTLLKVLKKTFKDIRSNPIFLFPLDKFHSRHWSCHGAWSQRSFHFLCQFMYLNIIDVTIFFLINVDS